MRKQEDINIYSDFYSENPYSNCLRITNPEERMDWIVGRHRRDMYVNPYYHRDMTVR